MAKNLVGQLLAEHELYQALFDAADDVLFCPHPGEPKKTGYPEGHHNDEAIPQLRAAFLALVDAEVPQLEDQVLVSLSSELVTQMVDALQAYYTLAQGDEPLSKQKFHRVLSGVIQTLQTTLINVAAHDPDVKERVRALLVVARGVVRGE